MQSRRSTEVRPITPCLRRPVTRTTSTVVELLEASEPDQVPAVPTDTEAAAVLTLRQAAGFA